MKKTVYLFIVAILFTSCLKDEEEPKPTVCITNPKIVGKWKLIKIENIFSGKNTNYTDKNVEFDFKPNQKVTVSKDNDVFLKGEYSYEIKKESITANKKNPITMVIIQNTKYTYKEQDNKMQLSNSYVDGPTLYFKKQ